MLAHKNQSENDIRQLSVRMKAFEETIAPLNVRIQTLEDINRNCDFPNSLSTLVD
jgi:hypothetical protein